KLENPSGDKKDGGVKPEIVKEKASEEKCQRNKDRGNTKCVAGAVDRMLMARGILRNPLLVGTVTWHRRESYTSSSFNPNSLFLRALHMITVALLKKFSIGTTPFYYKRICYPAHGKCRCQETAFSICAYCPRLKPAVSL